jgi:tRNA (guanine-N7-)-methyltransferase
MLKDYPFVSLKEIDLTGKIDFADLFGRYAPVEIEVGSGKGTFLINQAKAFPDINFLGIEWANKFYRHAVDRMGRWGLKNVKIIRTDAKTFFSRFVSDESLDCVHVYFPDPWPKKRHHRRRFFDQAVVLELLRCLKTGGRIQLATDHAGYFQQMEKVIAEQPGKLEKITFLPAAGAKETEIVGTNYERKYIIDKRSINCIAIKKI